MNGHRDPIEDWLSRDVEILPPPPGAFQRVRRRARRRKAIQAASVAAGVAVIIAAGISVPALTGSLFQGTGPARVNTSAPTARPSSLISRHPHPAISGPALSTAGNGPAAAAGFRPSSVTFVANGNGYLGAVLGQAQCRGQLCTALAGTRNYGHRWTGIGAPPAGPSQVNQVRFADQDNGWAFGPALYATHNGGVSWDRISRVTGRMVDLATVDGQVLAITATGCKGAGTVSGPGTAYATSCTGFELYAASATSDHFVRVLSKPGGGMVTPGGLQLQPVRHAGYLIAGGRLYSGALDGNGWNAVLPQSTSAPGCLNGQAAGNPALLAPSASVLYAACASGREPELYRSATSGRTWQAAGRIPATGRATSLAVSPAGTLVFATTRGLYCAVGGRTWRVASGSPADMGFGFVGMTTDRLGVAVPFRAAAGQLYMTTNGGLTWQPRRISP